MNDTNLTQPSCQLDSVPELLCAHAHVFAIAGFPHSQDSDNPKWSDGGLKGCLVSEYRLTNRPCQSYRRDTLINI